MGLKHLTEITELLICAEEPMTKADIGTKYETENNHKINYETLNESLKHLLKEKKIKTVKMRIRCRDRTGYKWVG